MLWIRPLLLTLQLMGLSIALAAVIGIPLAFLLSMIPRSGWTRRSIIGYGLVGLVASVATPMVLHAAAWEATAGKFGWMTFSQTASRTYTGFAGHYSGMVACAWIHGLYGAALVALATWFATSRVDRVVIDQSLLDGGPSWTWWKIRLPIAAPWVVAGLLATAILAATEMTVVDLYGVRTLADEFYLFHAAQPSMVSIMAVLVLPCILAISLICTLLLGRARRIDTPSMEHPGSQSQCIDRDSIRSYWIPTLAAFVVTFLFVFPLLGLIVKTGQQISVSDQPDAPATVEWSLQHSIQVLASAPAEFSREYQWTLVLAFCTAIVSVPLGWVIASLTRNNRRLMYFAFATSLFLFLIPGPIVGLAVVRFFTLPVSGFHQIYHESLVPTIVALLVRAAPIAFWVMHAGYHSIDSSVLDTARLDLSWPRRLWSVERPLLAKPLILAALASAVMASGDVPVTLPVIPPEVVTVGTRLFALLHSGARYQESALAFWYVSSIVLVAIVCYFGWKPSRP